MFADIFRYLQRRPFAAFLRLRSVPLMPASSLNQQDIATLYTQHHGWLQSWLLRRMGNHDEAADITQDTFVRVLHKPPVLNLLREPRAYLTTIARGLAIDHWRRQSLERAVLDALACLPQDLFPSEQDRLIAVQLLHELDQMLTRLSPNVRKVFVLSQLEGLTYLQIAQHMGISERTVKRHMAQGFEACLTLMLQQD